MVVSGSLVSKQRPFLPQLLGPVGCLRNAEGFGHGLAFFFRCTKTFDTKLSQWLPLEPPLWGPVFPPMQLLLISASVLVKPQKNSNPHNLSWSSYCLLLFCCCLLKDTVTLLSLTVRYTKMYRCRAESQALHRELAGLSERYSQKCLELNRAEQNNAEREREICRKERDLEQLRKENQVS